MRTRRMQYWGIFYNVGQKTKNPKFEYDFDFDAREETLGILI